MPKRAHELIGVCLKAFQQLNAESKLGLADIDLAQLAEQLVEHVEFYLQREIRDGNACTSDLALLASQRTTEISRIAWNYLRDAPLINALKSNSASRDRSATISYRALENKLSLHLRQRFSVRFTEDDLQNILQDTFKTIGNNEKLESFHYISRFSTWSCSILVYTAISHLKKKSEMDKCCSLDEIIDSGRHPNIEALIEPSLTPEESCIVKEKIRLMWVAIDKVISERMKNPARAAAIMRLSMEGKTSEEISLELGLSVNVVNVTKHRVIQKGREYIKEWTAEKK